MKQSYISAPTMLDPLETAAVVFELDLSREQHQKLRKVSKRQNASFVRSWKDIQTVHKECQPPGIVTGLDENLLRLPKLAEKRIIIPTKIVLFDFLLVHDANDVITLY